MSELLITNGRVVNEGETRELDILIRDGRIEAIGSGITAAAGARVIDAAGRYVLPGMIDDQVHFREPGLTHKGEIATESSAALAGGITSYMEMPNVNPPTTDREAIRAKYARAAEVSRANFAFYFGGTNDNIEEIRRVTGDDACALKVFMGASTGNMLVDDPDTLEKIFADSPLLIATHCEDSPMIGHNLVEARAKYGNDIPIEQHPFIRSEEACWKSSSFAVELAKKHDARLHVLHLTTAREMAHFAAGPAAGKRITAEACVHHLFFNSDDYATLGNRIKCNPAIKTPADQAALRAALASDLIDVIATDHAPHTLEEKDGNYMTAPAGLPLVQTALLSALELVHDGVLTIEQLAKKTSHAVADCYKVLERGYLREGYWADIVLVDTEKTTTVHDADMRYKCGWTPYDGVTFRSAVDTVIMNGEVALDGGKFNDGLRGMKLKFPSKGNR